MTRRGLHAVGQRGKWTRSQGCWWTLCGTKGIRVLVRGLRAFSDFEFEFQMALTNRKAGAGHSRRSS